MYSGQGSPSFVEWRGGSRRSRTWSRTARMWAVAVSLAMFAVPALAPAQDDPPATAPRNLTAAAITNGFRLSWDAPTENASSITGYQVLRSHAETPLSVTGRAEAETTIYEVNVSARDPKDAADRVDVTIRVVGLLPPPPPPPTTGHRRVMRILRNLRSPAGR